jgi:thiol-disulfide isomerase/thioredoxin
LWAAEFDQPNGEVLRLAQCQGKPLVLNFWATWCTPCVEEMPLLEAFFKKTNLKAGKLLDWQLINPAPSNAF